MAYLHVNVKVNYPQITQVVFGKFQHGGESSTMPMIWVHEQYIVVSHEMVFVVQVRCNYSGHIPYQLPFISRCNHVEQTRIL